MWKKGKYNVMELLKEFNLVPLNADDVKETIYITSPGVYRVGLELTGHQITKSSQKNVIAWGTKELNWFKSLTPQDFHEAIIRIKKEAPPLILISVSWSMLWARKIAKIMKGSNTTIATTTLNTSDISTTIGARLAEFFSEREVVHGSLAIINGIGVLIIGKSGVGKSEAVIELIQQGHYFVTDDSVGIRRVGANFVGFPVAITKHFLEARGIGLIDVQYIYGARAIKKMARIELVVKLEEYLRESQFDRLGVKEQFYKVLGGKIPLVTLPIKEGRSVSALIEAATNVFLARKEGMDPLAVMDLRLKRSK